MLSRFSLPIQIGLTRRTTDNGLYKDAYDYMNLWYKYIFKFVVQHSPPHTNSPPNNREKSLEEWIFYPVFSVR